MTAFHSLRFGRAASAGLAAAACLALLLSAAHAQQSYPSPEDAASALAAAVKTGTKRAMLKVLGGDASDIIDSGDDVADAQLLGLLDLNLESAVHQQERIAMVKQDFHETQSKRLEYI